MHRRAFALLAAGSVMALGVTLTLAPSATAQSPDEMAAAAKKEGKLTLYHNIRPAGIEVILQKFREKYPGIQTEQIRLGSGPLNERFRTEYDAGRNIADVLITFPDKPFMDKAPGWFAKWQPAEHKANFAPETSIGDYLFVLQQVRESIVWNKNLVKDADAPKEWADLLDPKWKSKVGLNTPWRSISVQQMFAYWQSIGIKDAAERMKANEVRFFEGSSGIIQAIIRGDIHVAHMTDIPLNAMLADGAPIGFTYPKSGTTLSNAVAGVAAKAPHPNAARLFLNWLMSAEGQALLVAEGGLSVTRKGAPALSHLPATAALPKTVDGMSVLTPDVQKPLIEHWRKVFGVK
ncbi:MAG TPA: extracellular solute-binding protein [Hyphomicrobiaceae bacterium]|nr:extracellular solute-binding protein [Hyphomicrobiaceae bacterium]